MTDPSGRRVHERFDCEIAVTLAHDDGEVVATCTNVSLGGMFVATDLTLPYGVNVTVRIRLPALKDETEMPAVVRWVTADGLGVQFGSLRALDVWALNQLFKR